MSVNLREEKIHFLPQGKRRKTDVKSVFLLGLMPMRFKRERSFIFLTKQKSGFSLVEMLVATAILILILAQMTSIINQSSGAIQIAKNRVTIEQIAFDTFTQIRRDFEGKIQISGTHILIQKDPGDDQIGFYSASARGLGDRNISWVLYRLEEEGLKRGVLGLDYGSREKSSAENNILRSFYISNTASQHSYPKIDDQDFETVSEQIIRFELWSMVLNNGKLEVMADPPTESNGSIDFERFRGILVAMVLVDSNQSQNLTPEMKESLAAHFPDAKSLEDPLAQWHEILQDQNALAQTSNIPLSLLKETRIYQHFFWFKNGVSK